MPSTLNVDGQPRTIGFNRSRNIEKATYVLNGIIDGVNADGKLTDVEIVYIDSWLKNQNFIQLEADNLDLFQAVKHVLESGEITNAEKSDLHQLIKDILKYGPEIDSAEESRINQFIGLLKGICSDGHIVKSEIDRVERWVRSNEDLSGMFPIKPINDRLLHALQDDQLSDDELSELSLLITEIAGDKFTQSGDVDGCIGDFFCDNVKDYNLTNKTICFTGKFLSGTRRQCEFNAHRLGAQPKSTVTNDLDVLVIGTVTSRDWRFQNFGRKVERAMELRASNGKPLILSEKQWIEF